MRHHTAQAATVLKQGKRGRMHWTLVILMALIWSALPPQHARAASASITVSGTQWGTSTCYIGANEGSARFNIADMQDAGINTYRLFGGMSRWEISDDDGVYGSPSIGAIKANPNVIPWSTWDTVMDSPTYSWAGSSGVYTGSSRTVFAELKSAGIRPVIVLRNRDNKQQPPWAPNPPTTTNDWNEWWQHVFTTVYWVNVRNNYQIDDWEIHNEPNDSGPGWLGTQAQYFEFARQTQDAIDYVYATYLNNRPHRIHAPVTYQGSSWPQDALAQTPTFFNTMGIHNYDTDIRPYNQQVHAWMDAAGRGSMELWMTEWATYTQPYSNVSVGITNILKNMVYASQPNGDYVYGSHIFSLFGWDTSFDGLIGPNGERRSSYYAFRMGTRALQGCKATYQSTSSSSDIVAITTKDSSNQLYMLAVNSGSSAQTVDVNLSALSTSGGGTLWEYSSARNDEIISNPALSSGYLSISIPANSAVLWSSKVVAGPPVGRTIWLKSNANSKYATAELNQTEAPLQAQATSVGTWEKYQVADAGNGAVAFKAANGKYVSAWLDATNAPLRGQGNSISTWETFQWLDNGDGTVALKAANDKYVSAWLDDTTLPLQARGSSIGTWEKFQWGDASAPIGQTIWLKANANNKYATAWINQTNAQLEAQSTSVGNWEKYQVVDAGGGYIALKAANGNYVSAWLDATNGPLRALATSINNWEKFQWMDSGDGYIGLKATNGRFLSAWIDDAATPLQARGTSLSAWEQFQWGVAP